MKKLLAIFLTVVMLVLSVTSAIPVFAADGPFVVGGTNYATLAEAVTNASANDTIYLAADYTSADDVGITVDKALTIKSVEGQKYTITLTAVAEASARWIETSANLTIENISVSSLRGIETTDGTLSLNGVKMDMSSTATLSDLNNTGSHAMIVATNATVNLSDTEMYQNIQKSGVAVVLNGTNTTLTLSNNSSITAEGTNQDGIGYAAVVFVRDLASAGKTTINVGKDCSINNKMTGSSLRPSACVRTTSCSTADRVVINLEEGSTLYMNNKTVEYTVSDKTYYPGWISDNWGATFTSAIQVNDSGCTYAAKYVEGTTETRFNPGVIHFPNVKTTEDTSNYKFVSNNEDLIDNNGSYKLTKDILIKFRFEDPAKYGNAFSIGNDTYKTLADAVSGATSGDTIMLNRDYSSSTDIGIETDKALTIKSTDGNKLTITANGTANTRWIKTSANLTIDNVDLDLQVGIEATAGNLSIKDSVVKMHISNTTATTTNGAHTFLTTTGVNITLSNTQIEHTKNMNGQVVYMTSGTLELKNGSTITNYGSGNTDNTATFSVVTTQCPETNGDNNCGNVIVGENCSIINSMADNGQYRPFSCVYGAHGHGSGVTCSNTANLTLAKGSSLELKSGVVCTAYNIKTSWIYNNKGFNIVDNGCTYSVVSKSEITHNSISFHTMYFPAISNAEEGQVFYTKNGETVEAGGSMTLTPNTVYEFKFGDGTPVIENGAGASIRKDAPYGIRFFAQVNDAAYQKLIADENVKSVTFGMVISNDDALTFSNSFFDNFSAYEGEGYVKKELTYDQLAADKTFSISLYLSDDPMLTETGATELQKMLYACSYYKIEYNDGTVEYVFADFDATQNARSFYQVAKTYQTTYGTGNAMIDGIVSKVDG